MAQGSLHWNHHSRYLLGTTPQNLSKSKILTQKWGRLSRQEHTDTFSHGPRAARRLVMLWQPPNASSLAGTGGIWGQQGQCLPPMCPLMGRGLSLPAPRGTAFCTGVLPRYAKENSLQGYIANKPNKRGFPITCTWDFRMCNGSIRAAPSTDYTPP